MMTSPPIRLANLLSCALAALVLVSLPVAAQQRQLLDRVVAIVDEDVVLLSELQNRLAEIRQAAQVNGQPLPPEGELRQEILDQLILENLQLQMAERVSIRFDDDTVNRVLTNMAANNGMSLNQYVATLERAGVYLQTREDVRRQLTLQELQRGMVNSRISVTNQEIENFLNSEVGREVMSADYLIEHMLIPISDGESAGLRQEKLRYAGDLVARIRDGENLPLVRAQAARSAPFQIDGTNFGWRKVERLPNLFASLVESMNIGQVEGPIEAGNGYHVIQLADRRGGTQQIVPQTEIRHIMLSPNEIRTEDQTQERIQELRARIEAGEDFATVARQNSDDASSVVAGGDLGWINAGGMPPEMERVINRLEVGELSEPFRTDTGWHIAEVLGRRETDLSQQYARAQAENALRNRKFDLELQNWMLEIREEAFVEIVE